MFQFEVQEGQALSFDIEQLEVDGPADVVLRLFDADGNELAYSDDDMAPDETDNFLGESYIEWTFDTAGTYYIAVSGSGNATYDPFDGTGDLEGQQGRYGLLITDPILYEFL
jgi:hypothetical protein